MSYDDRYFIRGEMLSEHDFETLAGTAQTVEEQEEFTDAQKERYERYERNQRRKSEAFVKLAEKRTNSVLRGIRSIGNLSNRSNYVYDELDVQKIVEALQQEIGYMVQRFDPDDKNPHYFSLERDSRE